MLSAGSTRNTGAGKAYRLPDGSGLIDLQLNFDGSDHSFYFVVIETADGQQVWRGTAAGVDKNENARVASISVPSRKLRKGDYVVSLKGRKENGPYEPVAEFTFTLER